MNAIINFKTDKNVKLQAQQIAEALGLNLSDILNIYLRNFIKVKAVHIDLKDESHPSKELLAAIKDAEKEYKSGKMKKFRNADEFCSYLDTL